MKRRRFIASLGGAALALPRFAAAQSRVASVAFLLNRLPPQIPPPFWRAFVEALRERGWDEGRNVAFHLRAAEGSEERYQQLAAERRLIHSGGHRQHPLGVAELEREI